MKKISVIFALISAVFLYSTTGLAEEKSPGLPDGYGQYKAYETGDRKDQCLIVAKNCTGGDDSVFKRVERLNKEIEKGAAVYTPEELNGFRDQLNWIYYESNEFPVIMM